MGSHKKKTRGFVPPSFESVKENTAPHDVENENDLSLIREPLLGQITAGHLIQIIGAGTSEVKDTLLQEFVVILECRVCRSLFRSLPNLLAHKRVYCRSQSSNGADVVPPAPTVEPTVVVQPTSPESDNELEEANCDTLQKSCVVRLESLEETGKAVKQTVQMQPASKSMTKRKCEDNTDIQDTKRLKGKLVTEEVKAVEISTSSESKNSSQPNKLPSPLLQKLMRRGDCDTETMTCLQCNTAYSSSKTLHHHLIQVHSAKRTFHRCPLCRSTFANSWSVSRHLQRIHKKSKEQVEKMRDKIKSLSFRKTVKDSFHLDMDKKKTKDVDANKTEVTSGIVEETKSSGAPAAKSEKNISVISAESNNKGAKIDSKVFIQKCEKCDKVFGRKELYEKHKKQCSWTKMQEDREKNIKDDPEALKKQVKEADENERKKEIKDTSKTETKKHVKDTTTEEARMQVNAESTSRPNEIKKKAHVFMDASTKLWNTLLDPKTGLSATDLKAIEKLVDDNTVTCLRCNQKYGSVSNLHRHAVRHIGWHRYKCKLCRYTSYNRSECKRHLRQVHRKRMDDNELESLILDLEPEESVKRSRPPRVDLKSSANTGQSSFKHRYNISTRRNPRSFDMTPVFVKNRSRRKRLQPMHVLRTRSGTYRKSQMSASDSDSSEEESDDNQSSDDEVKIMKNKFEEEKRDSNTGTNTNVNAIDDKQAKPAEKVEASTTRRTKNSEKGEDKTNTTSTFTYSHSSMSPTASVSAPNSPQKSPKKTRTLPHPTISSISGKKALQTNAPHQRPHPISNSPSPTKHPKPNILLGSKSKNRPSLASPRPLQGVLHQLPVAASVGSTVGIQSHLLPGNVQVLRTTGNSSNTNLGLKPVSTSNIPPSVLQNAQVQQAKLVDAEGKTRSVMVVVVSEGQTMKSSVNTKSSPTTKILPVTYPQYAVSAALNSPSSSKIQSPLAVARGAVTTTTLRPHGIQKMVVTPPQAMLRQTNQHLLSPQKVPMPIRALSASTTTQAHPSLASSNKSNVILKSTNVQTVSHSPVAFPTLPGTDLNRLVIGQEPGHKIVSITASPAGAVTAFPGNVLPNTSNQLNLLKAPDRRPVLPVKPIDSRLTAVDGAGLTSTLNELVINDTMELSDLSTAEAEHTQVVGDDDFNTVLVQSSEMMSEHGIDNAMQLDVGNSAIGLSNDLNTDVVSIEAESAMEAVNDELINEENYGSQQLALTENLLETEHIFTPRVSTGLQQLATRMVPVEMSHEDKVFSISSDEEQDSHLERETLPSQSSPSMIDSEASSNKSVSSEINIGPSDGLTHSSTSATIYSSHDNITQVESAADTNSSDPVQPDSSEPVQSASCEADSDSIVLLDESPVSDIVEPLGVLDSVVDTA